ncbi:hypothetical protein Peur_072024 [Populus x canadensis]
MLSNDSARACYGTKHVEVAHEEYMATQTLLITDKLIYQQGGREQLALHSAIAAVLRFPLPHFEDIDVQ